MDNSSASVQGSKANMSESTSERFLNIIFNNKWLFAGFAVISIKGYKTLHRFALEKKNDDSELLATVCFLAAIFITPIIICFVPAIVLYRFIVFIYLKQKWRHLFKGLLKGPDVMWAIETPESRSIINVLILLDMSFVKMKYYRSSSVGKGLLHTVRNVTDRSLLQPASPFPKLKWLRQKCRLGYYYWIHSDESTIEKFVRPLEIFEQCPNGLTKMQLETILGKNSNKPLPFDDQGTWEILVGQQHLVNTEMKKLYPILVRIHHSVGDGVALLRLFLEGLADKDRISLPANLRQTIWSESRRTNSSTEYDNDGDSDGEKEVVQLPQPSSPNISPPDISSSQTCIIAQTLTNDNHKNNFKVKVGSTLKNMLTKFKKKNSTPVKTSFFSPSKMKSFYLKERTDLIVWNLSKPPGLTKQYDTEASEIRTCVVPPQPRSVSPLLAPTPDIAGEADTFKHTHGSSSFSDIQQCASEIGELKNSEKHHIFIEKCLPFQNSSLSSTPLQRFRLAKEQLNFKSLVLYSIIALIISYFCIKQTLNTYFRIMYPEIRKCCRFCFLAPRVMFCQIFKTLKNDVLYGEKLSGHKVISWVTDESNINKSFRSKIKQIRDHYGVSTKFTHVLYACLSKSLHKYYLQRNAHVPPYINVVLPARVNLDDLSAGCQTTARCEVGSVRTRVTRLYGARKIPKIYHPVNLSFSSSNESDTEDANMKINNIHRALSQTSIKHAIKLENKFTVAMMKLPVGSLPLNQDLRLLEAVQEECNRLQNAPDYLANYWLLGWFAHLVPNMLLEPFLKAAPCTLVFSNLPGPEEVVHLSHIPIHDIIFWVPNRGLNGVGMGMLSYCGRFSTGIIIDKALITDDSDAYKIVKGIYDEVNLFICSNK